MILLIDNYDSFVFNLARYFQRLGQTTVVIRNDAITCDEITRMAPRAIVISPGPCTPNEAGCSVEVVRRFTGMIPILGICLGHQAIGAALGARIVRASEPVHGRASQVYHGNASVFAGLPNPLVAGRYHSLVVERSSLPETLRITAWTLDDAIMGFEHRDFPVVGLQFHPESILTENGFALLANFLQRAGLDVPAQLPEYASERVASHLPAVTLPSTPVTF